MRNPLTFDTLSPNLEHNSLELEAAIKKEGGEYLILSDPKKIRPKKKEGVDVLHDEIHIQRY